MQTCRKCGRENPSGFEFCGFCGTPLGAGGADVRKLVTVVFADVTGSTSLGEQLDPEAVRSVVSRYFEMAKGVMERHGGTVEKFIGDAVMAVFGVPEAHEDDALRGIRAAADLRETLTALNAEIAGIHGTTIQIRTGVNSGEVVAGDPSTGQSFVSGDAVNVAARLEQAARPGEILLGAETVALARDAVQVEPVEPLSLKGKADPVPAFRLLEVSRTGPAFARRLDAQMVGRDAELAALLAALERAEREPTCALVTVRGDAGVGKSRLIREMSSRSADRALVLAGHCLPYGEGISFWPIAMVVKQAARIEDDESPDAAREKIRGLVPVTDADADLIVARVANAIGLGGSESSIQETFWAIRRLFETLADRRPFVVVIDDIHWASSTLLDLIEYIASFSRGHPLLIACTARHEFREEHPDWGRDGTTIALQPLPAEDSTKLVDRLLEEARLPDDVRAMVVDSAGGNPLFLEEMARMLVADGLLQRDGDRWVSSALLSRTTVPTTVQALIAARLDRLENEERAVLQRGSVVGKVFYWGAVTELSPAPVRGEVGGHLQTLARRELIMPEASSLAGEDAFRFSHILVHDAAYASTPKRARADLHERFAAWLTRIAGSRLSEFEEIVGYHYEQAFRYLDELGTLDERARHIATEAATRLAAAGRRSSARGDAAATVNLLSRATALLPELDPERLALLPVLGAACTDAGRWQEADAILQEGISGARRAGDSRSEGLAVLKSLWLRLHSGTFESNIEAVPDLERATALFEELDDDIGLAECWILRGSIDFWSGDARAAVVAAGHALVHARRAGDSRREVDALRLRTFWQLWGATPIREALEGVGELSRTPAAANPMLRSFIFRSRGMMEAMVGNIGQAHDLIDRSKASASELGLEVDRASALVTAGYVSMLEGDHATAESEYAQAVDLFRAMGDLGHLSSYGPALADEVSAQGRYGEALALTEEGERAAIEGDMDAQVHWRRVRAKAWARLGKSDEAVGLATEAADLARTTDDLDKLGRTLMDLAEVLLLAGRPEDALATANEAVEAFDRKGNVMLASAARELSRACGNAV